MPDSSIEQIADKLGDALPDALPSAVRDWPDVALAVSIVLVVVLIVHRVLSMLVDRVVRGRAIPEAFVRLARAPTRWVLLLLALLGVLQDAPNRLRHMDLARHAVTLVLIAALTWLAVRALRAAGEAIELLNPSDVADNLNARRVRTQSRVVVRVTGFLIWTIGLASALMTFPGVRQVGTALLASAGVAGLVVGNAARPVLANLLAGLQIALTQPIRLDDVIIVEGEWGRVEEITGAYVVVHIWDDRRMVVPLQWFIEKPFQNWTRSSAALLGTVFLWVDYRTPIDRLRAELDRIVPGMPEWDGRVSLIQVTDANERAVQVRVLLSAPDSGQAFDLRAKVREALIAFIQRELPDCLPRLRNEMDREDDAPPGGGAGMAG